MRNEHSTHICVSLGVCHISFATTGRGKRQVLVLQCRVGPQPSSEPQPSTPFSPVTYRTCLRPATHHIISPPLGYLSVLAKPTPPPIAVRSKLRPRYIHVQPCIARVVNPTEEQDWTDVHPRHLSSSTVCNAADWWDDVWRSRRDG